MLTVYVFEVGLIEVKALNGSIRHEAGCFGDVLIEVEEEEFVLSQHHDVVAHLLH